MKKNYDSAEQFVRLAVLGGNVARQWLAKHESIIDASRLFSVNPYHRFTNEFSIGDMKKVAKLQLFLKELSRSVHTEVREAVALNSLEHAEKLQHDKVNTVRAAAKMNLFVEERAPYLHSLKDVGFSLTKTLINFKVKVDSEIKAINLATLVELS